MVLDPGGSGKGFAIDWVIRYLNEKEVGQACLDFGGNLYVMGAEEWDIGIRHPHRPGQIFCRVKAKNQAVSTSSWVEHCLERDGEIYGHIVNPRNGKPVKSGLSSVTVPCSKAVYADILSTAIYIAGEERGKKLVKRVEEEVEGMAGNEIHVIYA